MTHANKKATSYRCKRKIIINRDSNRVKPTECDDAKVIGPTRALDVHERTFEAFALDGSWVEADLATIVLDESGKVKSVEAQRTMGVTSKQKYDTH